MTAYVTGSGITTIVEIGEVIYVTDLNDFPDAVPHISCPIAKTCKAPLCITSVIDPSAAPSTPDAQMGMQFYLETAGRKFLEIKTAVSISVIVGDPEHVIVKLANESCPGLIGFVSATFDSHVVQKALMARVSDQVPCPVIDFLSSKSKHQANALKKVDTGCPLGASLLRPRGNITVNRNGTVSICR